ncbi:bifunctional helix-turn-helix transcriptional regulator/GNAT family N-acetyltransferase [Roseibium salinum]|uniref:Bifunctional helix-turn-helix transcriptional regulator/GNAT family N-acetyltransferase n=1 Tax=Roseibium salinum TaxID=1604349 RepID=A0ABT3R1W3_9HYPH|nr:bifunctional helix-turn-helix transcriptional regulator/GNAT family N-acetyltransferase [Roseibium sp. DSM 29163]MCX2723198.1 bifunctional helix-turn-helix transcriptional regulator/GNAT family N-acetyltransferase [Roseibium sp. DSM 29163]
MTHVSPDLVNDIRAASRRLVREFGFLDKTIAGTDLSGSGVHAILEIGLNPGLTAKDLVARLKLEKSTISRLLKSLEARGEIEQARSASDGRAFGLNLTQAGQQTFAAINRFADGQVRGALSRIRDSNAETVASALEAYADALAVPLADGAAPVHQYEIVEGYQTGMIGDVAAMHARTHGPIVGMGPTFESVVSNAMAEFMPRIGNPANNSWSVVENGEVIGSISIDGEDLGNNIAHLRWFILSERLRGKGLGKELLVRALDHCDRQGFDEIHLWTLKGLDAARSLYEKHGFELTDEYVGDQWGKAVTEQKFIRKRPGSRPAA